MAIQSSGKRAAAFSGVTSAPRQAATSRATASSATAGANNVDEFPAAAFPVAEAALVTTMATTPCALR